MKKLLGGVMNRLKTLTKPLIALFVVIVFAWLVFITRYQYKPNSTSIGGSAKYYERIDRWTGKTEYKVVGFDKNGISVETRWVKEEDLVEEK